MRFIKLLSFLLLFSTAMGCSDDSSDTEFEYTSETIKNTVWSGIFDDEKGSTTELMIYFQSEQFSALLLNKDPETDLFQDYYSINYFCDKGIIQIYSNFTDLPGLLLNGTWWITNSTQNKMCLVRDPGNKYECHLTLTKTIK